MKKIKNTIFVLALTSGSIFTSCTKQDPNSPGFEFMPDMYDSPSKEVYGTETLFGDTVYLGMPVKGTISRGYMPYAYPNTPEGYAASDSNKNPLTSSPELVAQGEVLYGKFCVHCHGSSGAGDGSVGTKLPGAPPSYLSPAIMALSEGKMFHSITHGKGLMGAHASMLTQQERWELVLYIKKLQLAGAPAPVVADSTQQVAEVKK